MVDVSAEQNNAFVKGESTVLSNENNTLGS